MSNEKKEEEMGVIVGGIVVRKVCNLEA